MRNYKKGFTLIELLVVIAIIGVLATIVLSSLSSAKGKALNTRNLSEARAFQRSLEIFHLENDRYPYTTVSNTITAGSSCENYNAGQEAAWDIMATDMGDLYPKALDLVTREIPHCMSYGIHSYWTSQCGLSTSPEYTILFSTTEAVNGLPNFVYNGYYLNCLVPIL